VKSRHSVDIRQGATIIAVKEISQRLWLVPVTANPRPLPLLMQKALSL
jgi:hypothetical protein